jgi:phosphatidylserine/phosphatidylglycerophosphate/cardiolipin synthase-like enzyme
MGSSTAMSSSVPKATSYWDSAAPHEGAVVAFGALLLAAHDPINAARALADYVLTPGGVARRELELAGIVPQGVDDFRALFPSDPSQLAASALCGAYWALGHRAQPQSRSRWFPVMSGSDLDREIFDRRTGETLISLIARAHGRLRLFSAYVDGPGLRALEPALAGATKRGVEVDLVTVRHLERDDASTVLASLVDSDGDRSRLHIHRLEGMKWFPHLKLLTADGSAAYIGSANMTLAGMTTNFEVGALVVGDAVVAFEALVDELVRRAKDEGGVPME